MAAAAGVTAPLRMTQRKPLGAVNVVDSKHHGNATQPIKVKSSVTAMVETKPPPSTELSRKPKSQQHNKEQLRTKLVPAGREQVCMKQRKEHNTCNH